MSYTRHEFYMREAILQREESERLCESFQDDSEYQEISFLSQIQLTEVAKNFHVAVLNEKPDTVSRWQTITIRSGPQHTGEDTGIRITRMEISGRWTEHSYMFDSTKFTEEQAKSWLDTHGKSYIKFETAAKEVEENYSTIDPAIYEEMLNENQLNESSYPSSFWDGFRELIRETKKQGTSKEEAQKTIDSHYGDMMDATQEAVDKPTDTDIKTAINIIIDELGLSGNPELKEILGESIDWDRLDEQGPPPPNILVLMWRIVSTAVKAAWNVYIKVMTKTGITVPKFVILQKTSWLQKMFPIVGNTFTVPYWSAVLIAVCLGVVAYYGTKIGIWAVKSFFSWTYRKIRVKMVSFLEAKSMLKGTEAEKDALTRLVPKRLYRLIKEMPISSAYRWSKTETHILPTVPFNFLGFAEPRFSGNIYILIWPTAGDLDSEEAFLELEAIRYMNDAASDTPLVQEGN